MSEESSESSQENEEMQQKQESEENKSEENLVKEENVEKEEEEAENHDEDNQEAEDNHEEEPETKEIEKKPKEEVYEREEPKEEEQDSQSESEPKEVEIPTEIILFSTLSREDKIKYFNFFIANNTSFAHEPEGTWIAEIDIYDDDKTTDDEVTPSRQKDNKNLRQSAFRSTKKDYDSIYSKLIKVVNPSPGIKGKKWISML